jgi:3-hydroxyisobutyrate dehydrogenase
VSTVAFIGLGRMGAPMAANLVGAGHAVRGFDLASSAIEAAAATGVEPAPSIVDAVHDADVAITMLPSGLDVLDCYRDPGGILASVARHALLVDCSTIGVESARSIHEAAEARGFAILDAPVSGGTVGAQAGTLTFMAGGASAAFERAQPLLLAMGSRAIHCGPAGAGQAAKICNNLLTGVSMVAVCAAFALGEALGLSHDVLFAVASESSGQCWSLTTNCPVPGPVPTSPANNDYRPGFTTSLMLKDLELADQASASAGVPVTMARTALGLYARHAAEGGGASDFSSIIRAIATGAA